LARSARRAAPAPADGTPRTLPISKGTSTPWTPRPGRSRPSLTRSIPDRRGAVVWRYRAGVGTGLGNPVGYRWGRPARLRADCRHLRAGPGGLHAIDLALGHRAWLAPPAPPICGKPSRACSSAQFSRQ
jgi:hypothetical protein